MFFCRTTSNVEVKIKASHTRYRALGPELIPVYRQSAYRWLQVIHPAVGCHYFPPGLQLPPQPQSITALWPVPSYTAWWQRHIGVNNLPKVVTQHHLEQDLNLRPVDRKPKCLTRCTTAPPQMWRCSNKESCLKAWVCDHVCTHVQFKVQTGTHEHHVCSQESTIYQ